MKEFIKLLVFVGFVLGTSQVGLAQVVPDGTYSIQVLHSGKCLDVSGADTAEFANLHQYACHNDENQQWQVTSANGIYTIKAVHSGKCLDVSGADTADFANVHQYSCGGSVNQQFRLLGDASATQIQAVHSDKCLDISGHSTEDFANLHQYPCHVGGNQDGFQNQFFAFTKVGSADTFDAGSLGTFTDSGFTDLLLTQVDDSLQIKVNGREIHNQGILRYNEEPVKVELSSHLTPGDNKVEVIATNGPGSGEFFGTLFDISTGVILHEWQVGPSHGQGEFVNNTFILKK